MQPVEHRGDLQRQQAAAAAEDAFGAHAVAVEDAVADVGVVAGQPIRRCERVPLEAGAHPVELVVRERLRFGERIARDRARVLRRAACQDERACGERARGGERDQPDGGHLVIIIPACGAATELLPGLSPVHTGTDPSLA